VTVGNSGALFLLLLLPLIVLLHILLRRMESRKVSSLMIWERVQKRRKYRIPTLLILILQLLLVGLLSLAMADIRIPFTIPLRRENSVLLIDNSASMNVVEEGQSRLEDALKKAENVIKGSLGEVMIVTTSYPPRIISSYSNNREKLIDSLNSIEATELRNGVEEAMKIASASVTPEGSIIMISDGAFNYSPSETDNFKFIRAGKEFTGNLAITDFYLRKKISSESYELYMEVNNFSSETAEMNLVVYKGENEVKTLKGEMAPWTSRREIFTIDSAFEQEVRAELLADDLLSTDNRASAYISSNKRKRVLLVTPGNFFLEKALESIPEIQMEKFTGMLQKEREINITETPLLFTSAGIPVQEIPDNYDLVIYDRIPPNKNDQSGRFMYIDILPSGAGERAQQDKIKPQAVSISEKHPVTESVDFSGVTVLEARPPVGGPQIRELVSGGNTGLLYAQESTYLRFVYVPFDITDSDLPLRPSFPILIRNAVEWLTENYSREDIKQSRTGDPLFLGRMNPLYKSGIISLPSGREATIAGNSFVNTDLTGLYRMEYGKESQYFAVNLNSGDESDITSRFPEITEEEREEKTGEYKIPILSVLLILALLVLTFEWIVQEAKW